MDISATYKGNTVNIVDIDVNGSTAYITYRTTGSELVVDRISFPTSSGVTSAVIATGAVGA